MIPEQKKKSSDDGIKDKRDDNNSPPVHLPSLHSSKKESRLMHWKLNAIDQKKKQTGFK